MKARSLNFCVQVVAVLTLCGLWTALLWAQSGASTSLRGTITDPVGAVIPGVSVSLTNVGTGLTRSAVTGNEGYYEFAEIPPGSYRVRVELPGFKTLLRENVDLMVNTPATLNLRMELGAIDEIVTVSAEASPLNTTDASVGIAVGEMQIRQLPLLTRNVVALLSLQPAVTASGEVAGGRNDQNNVTLDGVDVNDQQSPGAFESVLPIPLDSVQEFRVTTVGTNANLGRSGGGQVALITKSGTNSWHGTLYEFHRNTKTAANSFFNNKAGIEREALIRNQFGFSVGGPIKKDRAFFFLNFEQRLDRSADSQSREIPTTSMKQGILSFRASDGSIQTLSPEEMAIVDPGGLGNSPAMIQRFQLYPDCPGTPGCDPDLGIDRGLNFSGFRFNAPFRLDQKAYVAKFDFNLTEDGRHALSWRGTLADNVQDANVAQFPGQGPASELIDNSRGFSANYTAAFRPNLVNSFIWGFTRQGIEQSGVVGDILDVRSMDEPFAITPRGFGRKVPAHNIANDLTWIKGDHTFQGGVNLRTVTNDRFSFGNSFFSYFINNGALFGLGTELADSVNAYVQGRSAVSLASGAATPIIRAGMAMMGVIADGNFVFQFDRNGDPLPRGAAQLREFAVREYEAYFQDSWRIRPNLTLTMGLRYSNFTPPWERNGLQVATTVPLESYWNERHKNAQQGIPSNASDLLSFDLNGPENGKNSWWERDNNNFAPRLALAWSPELGDGFWGKFLGSNGRSVFRAGAGVVYDRFGSEMIVNFDGLGSVGVATTIGFPDSFNFATAPRFTGQFPTPPAAPEGGFPNTPDLNFAIITNTFGLASDLKAPYSYLLNFMYSREVANNLTIEAGYVGRLSRKTLAQLDIMSPLNTLLDPESGMNWIDATGITRGLHDSGLTQGQVAADPSLVPTIPYIENMFPDLADFFIPGSASANFFFVTEFIPFSEGDILDFLDRGLCIAKFGCHTFFGLQYSSMPTWFNSGFANYHGFTLSARKRWSEGLAFGFNYTWSHSIDNTSSAETGAGQFGGVILDAFNLSASRGDSDFDIRHQFNTNFLWDLPFGQDHRFAGGIPGWLDQIIGGWQLSGIVRYQTGLPVAPGTGFNFSTNYFLTGRAAPTRSIETEVTDRNEDGVPGLFFDKEAAAASFRPQRAGETGPRSTLRSDDFVNTDLGISKFFDLPWGEDHRLQFRWEMFNAFNNVNFGGLSLDPIDEPSQFGEFSTTSSPRVMQFALKYEF